MDCRGDYAFIKGLSGEKLERENSKKQIFVKFNNQIQTIEIGEEELVDSLKEKINSKFGVPPELQWLLFGMKSLLDGRRLGDYEIFEYCTIQMNVKTGLFRIFLRTANGDRITFNVR